MLKYFTLVLCIIIFPSLCKSETTEWLTDEPTHTTEVPTSTRSRTRTSMSWLTTGRTTRKKKIPVDTLALFYCEKLKLCNVIPTEMACGRDWVTGSFAWFKNICVLWKMNCYQLGNYFNQDVTQCSHLGTSSAITNSEIDRPYIKPPLNYNPFYTYDKRPIKLG